MGIASLHPSYEKRAAISWYHPRFRGVTDMINPKRQRFRITMEPWGGRLEL